MKKIGGAYAVGSVAVVSKVVGTSCGRAETENTEKSTVIETAKMVDFIMI